MFKTIWVSYSSLDLSERGAETIKCEAECEESASWRKNTTKQKGCDNSQHENIFFQEKETKDEK